MSAAIASVCPNCGHRNALDANFCSSCGTALGGGAPAMAATGDETTTIVVPLEATAEPDDDVSVTLDDLPEGMGLVVVKRGPNAGSRFALEHEVTRVGRHPDSDIFLDDITVSRRHAEFVRRPSGGGHVVRDVGSLNGTYVNRERIEEASLANGDEVQVGKFKLVFLAGAGAPGGG